MNALDQAVVVMGTQSRLAQAIGIRSPSISGWRAVGKVPIARCEAIERATSGAVTRSDLRPDIWSPEDSRQDRDRPKEGNRDAA
jgi:DNA-binding transcriptional regulator YdaS (Cro superfamily)